MNSNESKVQEILKQRGIDTAVMDDVTEADIPEPCDRFKKLQEIYYVLKVSADMETPYWYNRLWWENDGDLLEVRRARAVAGGYAHTTPTILPWEKLVMNKTKNVRGAFPFPWVTASFFNAQAEALMNEVDAPAESEADAVSQVGAGGGNVTESYGEIICLAKKFGMRKEDIPVLVKVSKPWDEVSVEALSTTYAKMLPGYDQFERIMDSVVCMFDSYAIPQGREVMNYYLPLQYGFDGIMKICDEKIAEYMGEAGDDGLLGMSRGYYYAAMKEVAKGLSQWCQNYADKAKDFFKSSYKGDIRMITSVITVEEYKVFPYRTGQHEYIVSFERLMNVLDINIVSIDKTIADKAARIRAEYKAFKAMDALHLATACITGCDLFLTNDKQLRQFGEIKCITVEELE